MELIQEFMNISKRVGEKLIKVLAIFLYTDIVYFVEQNSLIFIFFLGPLKKIMQVLHFVILCVKVLCQKKKSVKVQLYTVDLHTFK